MKSLNNMRNAFSMITAIFVIVIMASVSVLVLSLSGKMAKQTTAQYQREQAALWAKSYTEYAIMAITANDRQNSGCLENINASIGPNPSQGEGYEVQVRIAYISNNIGKASLINCSATRRLSINVGENKTPLSAIIDVYVRYKDPENPGATYWFTYHRRTLQKI